MIRFCLFTGCLFLSLTFSGMGQTSTRNLLRELIDLPAPPPPALKDADESSETSENLEKETVRPQSFYEDQNVPPDEAPIDDLLAYWSSKASQNYYGNYKPLIASIKSAQRILEEVKNEPERLQRFLKILPAAAEVANQVKQIFDRIEMPEESSDAARKAIRGWLKLNSRFYLDELAADAQKAKDHPKYFTVEKESELQALVKIDWERARPILEKLAIDTSNPRTAAWATKLFYDRARAVKNQKDEQLYRAKLKAILTNPNLPGRARDIASDALFLSDWEGQDEYYLSLMSNKTLFRLRDGIYGFAPLMTLPRRNPDKWIPILAKLVGHQDRTVHSVAVMYLVNYKRKDALEPLLPWLTKPDWTDITWVPGGRSTYMQIVDSVDLPQSVPGLIWIIENDGRDARWAADALAHYKDPRAIPALKARIAKEKDEEDRDIFIQTLFACGGFSVEEQLTALEAYASQISTAEGLKQVEESYYAREKTPLPLAVSIGQFLASRIKPDEVLVLRLLERQKALQLEKPEVAEVFSGILARWRGRVVNLQLLEKIKSDAVDTQTIVGALARRKELRETVLDEIKALPNKSGLSESMASCLLEDENRVLQTFRSNRMETKISVLACARLLRLKLPVPEVADYLNNTDQLLALAAERYLESEDSPAARNFVLAKHPNEALILGARNAFNPTRMATFPPTLRMLFATTDNSYLNSLHPSDDYYPKLDEFEDKLREELRTNPELVEIFSLVPNYVLRVYRDQAVLTWYENEARYRETVLPPDEIKKLKDFWESSKIDELPPRFGNCHYDCSGVNAVRVNKNGGRRFFAYTGYHRLTNIYTSFQSLSEKSESKILYYSQNKTKDLQILFADDAFSVRAIWKNGKDFRVLVENKEREAQIESEIDQQNEIDNKNEDLDWEEREKRRNRRRAERAFEHFEWRRFENGKLGQMVAQPADVPFLRDKNEVPDENLVDYRTEEETWKVKGGQYEVYAGNNNKKGLWKVNRSRGETKLNDGWYAEAIITPDGKWAIAPKTDSHWGVPNYVVRVNVETGEEYKIDIAPAQNLYPLVFVPEHNKVLIYSSDQDYVFEAPPARYYLLDAESGAVRPVNGEFRPLQQQTIRPLQKTGIPDEYWAAIYNQEKNETRIGRYNAKTFSFTLLKVVPELNFNSMRMWVDEAENTVYVMSGKYDNFQLLNFRLKN